MGIIEINMNKKQIEDRRTKFTLSKFTIEESEAIERIIADKSYSNKDLVKVNAMMLVQNAKSNSLSNKDKYYINYLKNL